MRINFDCCSFESCDLDACVKKRCSKHYRVAKEELEWFGGKVEELGGVVRAARAERLTMLEAILARLADQPCSKNSNKISARPRMGIRG